LATVISDHMGIKNNTSNKTPILTTTPSLQKEEKSDGFEKCPQCGLMAVKNENGCRTCGSCGWEQCSI